jgi:hypothetical protein
MSRLFLSHSSDNNAETVAIRDWVAGEGWNEVFLDLDPGRGIMAGERWERALNEADLLRPNLSFRHIHFSQCKVPLRWTAPRTGC